MEKSRLNKCIGAGIYPGGNRQISSAIFFNFLLLFAFPVDSFEKGKHIFDQMHCAGIAKVRSAITDSQLFLGTTQVTIKVAWYSKCWLKRKLSFSELPTIGREDFSGFNPNRKYADGESLEGSFWKGIWYKNIHDFLFLIILWLILVTSFVKR